MTSLFSHALIRATLLAVASSVSAFALAHPAPGRAPFGTLPDGQRITQYTLKNKHGIVVKFIDYGAIITAIETPDRKGKNANIVLGFRTLDQYRQLNGTVHFGSIIGRYANRIAQGRFQLDQTRYQLPTNDGANTLHGGDSGLDTKIWQVKPLRIQQSEGYELTYVSPDGENSFPGTVTIRLRYFLTDDDALHLNYSATSDRATVINLTNHSYFNLGGEGSGTVENQWIQIAATRFTPTDRSSIPTGELRPVAGTPFDLRRLTPIGRHLRDTDDQLLWAHGYDHNFVLDQGGQSKPAFAARVVDPQSGRVLDLETTEPGLQFYTANGLDGHLSGTSGKAYRQTDAFALEAEHFPDSPNHPNFPSTVLKPGQRFAQETVLRFRVQTTPTPH